VLGLFERFARPLLRAMDPEDAHALALRALRLAPLPKAIPDDARLATRAFGLTFPNPVGLAAGFDKNCTLMSAVACLGFGFITVGSIMPAPRYGNPFPRLARYPDTQSLADAMGVPSEGRDA